MKKISMILAVLLALALSVSVWAGGKKEEAKPAQPQAAKRNSRSSSKK